MTINRSININKNLSNEDRFTNAKAKLMLSDGFTGQILSYLKITPSTSIPTMATDGDTLYYNEIFLKQLTKRDLIYVLAHEAWHCMLKHQLRGKRYDSKIYNKAADYAVNVIIETRYSHSKALKPLLDYQYENCTVEEIYQDLINKKQSEQSEQADQTNQTDQSDQTDQSNQTDQSEQPEQTNQSEQSEQLDQPDQTDQTDQSEQSEQTDQTDQQEPFNYDEPIEEFGDVLPAPKQDKSLSDQDDLTQQEEQMNRRMYQAYVSAGQSLSVEMRNAIKAMLLPKKNPWHEILAHYIDEIMQNDYSWVKPNRRYNQSDVMIPSLFNRDVSHAVICIDASGSISNDDLELYASYITQLLETYPGLETTVIVHSVDPDIENIKHYTHDDLPLELNLYGGGGTKIMPTIEYIDAMDIEPRFVLWFTDLGFWDEPEYAPNYPIFFLDNYHNHYTQQIYQKYGEIIEI